MQELKLHSQGQVDHLSALKEKYYALKKSLTKTGNLTEKQKQAELKKIKKQFEKDKKDAGLKLF